jgi:mitochondrial translocator assembly and maintenance protein 41
MSVKTMSTFRAINKTRSLTSYRSLRYIYNTSKLSATATTESTPSSTTTNSTPPPPPPVTRVMSISKQIKITPRNSLKLHPNFGKNQNLPIDDEFKERLKKVLHNFQAPIRYSIAYGSGVFPQKGYDDNVSCICMIYNIM